MPVVLPLDHLVELWPEKFRGAPIGVLLHPASISAKLEHASRILERHNGDLFRLSAFFGPQHGFLGQTQDNMVEWKSYEHPRLHIPVYSLYGEHREPIAEMLTDLDVLLVDLQDVGARYYTFIWTVYLCVRACEKARIQVVVLDRPNPINGVTIEGPLLDPNYKSFVGLHPIPVRHGKPVAELALQFRNEVFPDCGLSILPMKNWERQMWFDQTGLPWVMPSPNMPTLDTATPYPGMCLLEGTNISAGRSNRFLARQVGERRCSHRPAGGPAQTCHRHVATLVRRKRNNNGVEHDRSSRYSMARSCPAACVRERKIGAASSRTQRRILHCLYSLLHTERIRIHFRTRLRCNTRHKTWFARAKISTSLYALRGEGRLRPARYTGKRTQLHSLQRRRFICVRVEPYRGRRSFGPTLFRCAKVDSR